MTRWLLVLLVTVATAVSLLGARDYVGQRWVADELLAHEVVGESEVVALVPGVAQRLTLSSWLVIAPDPPFDPRRPYQYSLDVALMTADERVLFERTFETMSRISGDPTTPMSEGQFAARLVRSADWVTDSRTVSIDVSALGGEPGLVRVRSSNRSPERVLVRLSFAQARGELEREVVARTLDHHERRELMEGRSALGFSDLSNAARERALATWGRRLIMRGREGVDYATRRLLIGNYRFLPDDDPAEYAGVWIGGGASAAFNFVGPVELRVYARAGTKLSVSEEDGKPVSLLVAEGGQADIALSSTAARTVVIGATTRTLVHFSMPAEHAPRQIGTAEQKVRGDRVVVVPDVQRHRYLQLRRDEPVVLAVAAGQEMVGISLRASGESTQVITGRVTARWRDADGSSPDSSHERVAELAPSSFEVADEQPVSDPQVAVFRPPRGATALELTGDPHLMVSLWTEEPGVEERRIDPAYDVELPEDRVWRYAPSVVASTATVHADNDAALAAEGRLSWVLAQVRIEPVISEGTALAERVLTPTRSPIERSLMVEAYHGKGAPAEATTWTPIVQEPTALVLPGRGPRAGELDLIYRANEEALGAELRVRVDGRVALTRPIAFRTGQLTLPLDPGSRKVSIDGLGDGGQAYAAAAPTEGGAVAKRQSVYELSKAKKLVFSFDRGPGEILSFVIVVVSEGKPMDYRISYRLDDGDGEGRGEFLRRLTQFSGALAGRTGTRGRGLLWEAGTTAGDRADAVGDVRLLTGDDLAVGRHSLELALESGGGPLWARVVLAGRRAAPASSPKEDR